MSFFSFSRVDFTSVTPVAVNVAYAPSSKPSIASRTGTRLVTMRDDEDDEEPGPPPSRLLVLVMTRLCGAAVGRYVDDEVVVDVVVLRYSDVSFDISAIVLTYFPVSICDTVLLLSTETNWLNHTHTHCSNLLSCCLH